MRYVDLKTPYQLNKQRIDAAIHQVLEHGQYLWGPEITQVEQALGQFAGVRHAIMCASGTVALQVALLALGVGPGDEVITTSFSFFSTASCILLCGATPVFVDIRPDTYAIDPDLIAPAITSATKAIIPVSLYGQCADMDEINAVAAAHDLAVIEDAGQSFGALYHGRRSCSLATIGCTSFFPSKSLACYGDGGACFTDDDELAQRMRIVMDNGQQGRYHHVMLGPNGRMDSLQAAVLLAKLPYFVEEIAMRQQVANWYQHYLSKHLAASLPVVLDQRLSVYAQYTLRLSQRQRVRDALQQKGIPTAVHYPTPIHHQPCMLERLTQSFALPHAEQAALEVLSLPFHPYLKEHEVKQVADAVIEAVGAGLDSFVEDAP